ncbi:MAG: hypothetical protein QNI85_09085 [Desulfobacterales bacterium]|nr:hypothetical protein [Desulfobacterales bacterium]
MVQQGIIILIAGDIGNLLAAKTEALEDKNVELISANEEVYRWQGILPICCSCKKPRATSLRGGQDYYPS